jgi:hypothetical protein
MHYYLQGLHTFKMPDGSLYEHTKECYSKLQTASEHARVSGIVPISAFADGRNDKPHTHTFESTKPICKVEMNWKSKYEPTLDLPTYTLELSYPQPYYLEIWCEKSGPNRIILPLAQMYDATYQQGIGQLSWTIAVDAVERIKDMGKPTRIMYLSDNDGAGMAMPRAMSRKLEFLLQKETGLDVQLMHLFLTDEQIATYNLPKAFNDETKSAYQIKYQNENGGYVELDTMSGMHPQEFRDILKAELDRFYDHELSQKILHERIRIDDDILTVKQDEIYAAHQSEIDKLEELKQAYTDLYTTIKDELEAALPDLQEEVELVIKEEDVEEWEVPLYDSRRSYMEQLPYYKQHKGEAWVHPEARDPNRRRRQCIMHLGQHLEVVMCMLRRKTLHRVAKRT